MSPKPHDEIVCGSVTCAPQPVTTMPMMNSPVVEPMRTKLGRSNFLSSSLYGEPVAEPAFSELVLDHQTLVDRAASLRDSLRSTKRNNNIYLAAASAAVNRTHPVLEDESALLLNDLARQQEEGQPSSGVDNKSSSYMSLARVTPWHGKLSQRRAGAYLTAMESVVEQVSVLDNTCESTVPRLEEGSEENDQVSVSCWTLPDVVFDIVMGRVTYDSSSLSNHESSSKRKASSGLDGIGRQSMNASLPIHIDIHAIVQVCARDVDVSSSLNDVRDEYRECSVEILRCSHTGRGLSGSLSSVVGDLALLLAIKPLAKKQSGEAKEEGEGTAFAVRQARMFQSNATAPRPHASVDVFTSSSQGEEEVTVALRFQTRRCEKAGEAPKLRVDLVLAV